MLLLATQVRTARLGEYRLHARHRLELPRENRRRPPVHLGVEFRGERAEIARQERVHVLVAHAGKALRHRLGRDRMADRLQRLRHGAAGDDLAVDEHAVAVEDDEIDAAAIP